MATIGPLFCGTGASFNDGGTTAWTNPTNIQGDTTSTAATCNVGSNGGTSHKLRASNFGFTGLGGATIDGVTVEIERNAANANRHYENNIQLLKGGTETGDNKSTGATIPTGKAFKTFGGAADGWGAGLVAADVMASGFGVSFKISRSSVNTTTTSVYRVRITVDYTAASFSANAVIRKSITPSPTTADAITLRTQPGSGVLDAIRVANSGTQEYPASAISKETIAGPGYSIESIRRETFASDLAAEAIRVRSQTGSFLIGDETDPGGAWIISGAVVGDFSAEAVRRDTFSPDPFPVAAIRLERIIAGPWLAESIRKDSAGSSFELLAIRLDTIVPLVLPPVDAIKRKTWSDSFPVDALRLRTQPSSFLIGDAVDPGGAWKVLGAPVPQSGEFSVEATLKRGATGSFVVDATIPGPWYARPDGNITQSHFTNGYEQINEAVEPFDADYAFSDNNKAAVLEVSLSNVTDPLVNYGHTFRYRIAKTFDGNVFGGGETVTVTAALYQGSTLIASDVARTATDAWTGYSYTLSASQTDAITNYADLRLRFSVSASGGTPENRRGAAISWAVLEIPVTGVISSFVIDAFIRGWFWSNAAIKKNVPLSLLADARLAGTFTINAWKPITARAWIAGRFMIDAYMAHWLRAQAAIYRADWGQGSFTASAKKSGIFWIDAYIATWFTANAVKAGTGKSTQSFPANAEKTSQSFAPVRVSQAVIEAVVLPDDPAARVSQAVIEAVVLPDDPAARVSQAVIEAVVSPIAPARLSQLAAEVVVSAPSPTVQVSQVVAELVVTPIPPPIWMSQVVVEVLHSRGFYKTFTINSEIKRIFQIDAFVKPWFTVGWAWQSPPGTMRATHVLDSWVKGRIYGSFVIDAFIKPWFTIDARKCGGGSFMIDAKIQYFPANAVLKRNITGTPFSLQALKQLGFFMRATIRWRSFIKSVPLEARIAGGGNFTLNARKSPRFTANAVIYRPAPSPIPTFTIGATKNGPGRNERHLLVDAYLKKGKTSSFKAGWYTVAAVVPGSFTMDCWVGGIVSATLAIDAEISEVTRYRSFLTQWDIALVGEARSTFPVDAMFGQRVTARFILNAVIPIATSGRWHMDAWIAPWFSADAYIRRTQGSVIWANAWKARGGSIVASAFVARNFRINAMKAAVFVPGTRTYPLYMLALIVRNITAEAWISPWGGFTADAFIHGHLKIDAFIRGNQIVIFPGPSVGGVVITDGGSGYTSPPDVIFSGGGGSGAAGYAVIDNGQVVSVVMTNGGSGYTSPPTVTFSGGGGAGATGYAYLVNLPTDPWGGPPPVSRRFRVAIWIGQRDWYEAGDDFRNAAPMSWTEITQDVIWRDTQFVQEAKVNPGTFQITLRGAFDYIGGEEVRLEIDEFRQFAGTVTRVERGYFFDDKATPKTVLFGSDYNAILDRRFVYNREWEVTQLRNTGLFYGPYRPPLAWPKGIKDRALIIDIFTRCVQPFGEYYQERGTQAGARYSEPSAWVDLGESPLDYRTFVDEIDTPAPENNWALESGMSLRQVLASISRITRGVWWVDPFWNLHYHSRAAISAPFPITDGEGGISCRNLRIETDMSMMINDVLIFGMSGTSVPSGSEKNKVIPRHNELTSSVRTYGRRQYAEFRTDLIGYNHVHKRSASIIERYATPITRAEATIWEPGYQAGMVVEVSSSEYNASASLVIRQLRISFATSKEPVGSVYYGIPQFDLIMGLDPEEPWNIYDYLPYPGFDESGGGNLYGA